jgi:hypothetical protein
MLMVVLSAVRPSSVLLVLVSMRMMLMILVVLERLAQTHVHIPVPICPSVHHYIVALVRLALVVHAEVLGRLRAWRSRRRRSVCVEGYSAAASRR